MRPVRIGSYVLYGYLFGELPEDSGVEVVMRVAGGSTEEEGVELSVRLRAGSAGDDELGGLAMRSGVSVEGVSDAGVEEFLRTYNSAIVLRGG